MQLRVLSLSKSVRLLLSEGAVVVVEGTCAQVTHTRGLAARQSLPMQKKAILSTAAMRTYVCEWVCLCVCVCAGY